MGDSCTVMQQRRTKEGDGEMEERSQSAKTGRNQLHCVDQRWAADDGEKYLLREELWIHAIFAQTKNGQFLWTIVCILFFSKNAWAVEKRVTSLWHESAFKRHEDLCIVRSDKFRNCRNYGKWFSYSFIWARSKREMKKWNKRLLGKWKNRCRNFLKKDRGWDLCPKNRVKIVFRAFWARKKLWKVLGRFWEKNLSEDVRKKLYDESK